MGTLIYFVVGFLWAAFAGYLFSTIGGGGGVLVNFGFISLLNINHANAVKLMSQILATVSPLIAFPIYLRQDRVKRVKGPLFSIGIIMIIAAFIGAIFGAWLSKNYLGALKSFKYLFGYMTLAVGLLMVYKFVMQWKRERSGKEVKGVQCDPEQKDPGKVKFSFKKIEFMIANKKYSASPSLVFVAGFIIATIAATFGVGGGFLAVPFLTDVIDLPIFLAAGISLLVVLTASVTSVVSYLKMGVHAIIPILVVELVGIIIGSIIGPKISQYLNEKIIKYLLMILLIFIGVLYIVKP